MEPFPASHSLSEWTGTSSFMIERQTGKSDQTWRKQPTAIPRATLIEVKVKNPKYPSDKNLDIFCLAHTASILKMDEMMLVLVVVVVVVATRNSGVSEYSSWKLS